MLAAFLLFSFVGLAQAENPSSLDLPIQVDELVQSVLDGKQLTPKTWPSRLQTEGLDLSSLLHTDFPGGIAFGATASKVIDVAFTKVNKWMNSPNAIVDLVSNVATLREIHKISDEKDGAHVALAIKVPVVSDFHAVIAAHIYQDAKGRQVLLWKRADDSPDLVYTEGALVCEKDDNKTKVFVIGIHILKPVRKVPWLGRATAKSFAKTHYGNFITGLEKILAKE